jgi:hypothetical protein
MRKILRELKFVEAGKPYASGRGKHHLQLFLRKAAQQGVAAEADKRRLLSSATRSRR